MTGNSWTIFKKELLDTLRDRKTLMFMLLIPTLVTPALMIGGSRLVENIMKKKAVERITIVASEEDHAHYRGIVHRWFKEANRDMVFRFALSVGLNQLAQQDEGIPAPPPTVYGDPVEFETWINEVGDYMTEALSTEDLRERLSEMELPEGAPEGASGGNLGEMQDTMQLFVDFYTVALRGLAFVDFEQPDDIDAPPVEFIAENIPQDLLDQPNGLNIAAAIRGKRIQGYLQFPEDPTEALNDESKTMPVTLWYDSTMSSSDEAETRVSRVLSRTGELVVKTRLRDRSLSPDFLTPMQLEGKTNLASRSQEILAAVGGFLPYLVIVYAFLGALYPAIDLGAGEKERNTLETLLLAPPTRTEIALGKFLVILLASLTASILGVASIAISFYYIIPAGVLEQANLQLDYTTMIAVTLLALPPAAAISGIFLAISIFARSFKEAQNYIAPMQFLIILPPLAAMLPGIEMNWKLAWVPLVNVSLLAKEFLKGDINWGYYVVTFASTILLAAACIGYCVWQFRREEVLFRT